VRRLGHGHGPVLIGAPHPAGQSVDHAVGDAHGVVVVLIAEDREYRSEDLLLGDLHVGGDLGEHGGLHEEPGVEALRCARSPDDHLGAVVDTVDTVADVALDPFALGRRRQGPSCTPSSNGLPTIIAPAASPAAASASARRSFGTSSG